jgi:hypothetical protein
MPHHPALMPAWVAARRACPGRRGQRAALGSGCRAPSGCAGWRAMADGISIERIGPSGPVTPEIGEGDRLFVVGPRLRRRCGPDPCVRPLPERMPGGLRPIGAKLCGDEGFGLGWASSWCFGQKVAPLRDAAAQSRFWHGKDGGDQVSAGELPSAPERTWGVAVARRRRGSTSGGGEAGDPAGEVLGEHGADQVREQRCSSQGGIGGTQRIQPAEALQLSGPTTSWRPTPTTEGSSACS